MISSFIPIRHSAVDVPLSQPRDAAAQSVVQVVGVVDHLAQLAGKNQVVARRRSHSEAPLLLDVLERTNRALSTIASIWRI